MCPKIKLTISQAILQQGTADGTILSVTDTQEYIMTQRQRLLKLYLENHKIWQGKDGRWCTATTPQDRNHSGLVRRMEYADIEDIAIAFQLGIERRQPTLRMKWEQWKETTDMLPRSVDRKECDWNRFYDSHPIADIPLNELTEKEVSNFCKYLMGKMTPDGKIIRCPECKISNRTYIGSLYILRHLLPQYKDTIAGVEHGRHDFTIKKKRPAELAFSKNEYCSLTSHLIAQPNLPNLCVMLALISGLRSGELVVLNKGDYDARNNSLYIHSMIAQQKGADGHAEYYIADYTKTETGTRTVYISEQYRFVMQMILDASDSEWMFPMQGTRDKHLYIPTFLPMTPDKALRRMENRLGFTYERSLHDCRRTYASLLYLSGVNIKIIQSQLGHSSASQTWDYIKDVVDVDDRKSAINAVSMPMLTQVNENSKKEECPQAI